jgi:anti-anti-sigma factor
MQVRVGLEGQQVALIGRLDVHTVADVRQALHSAIASGAGDLVLDVSETEVGDATGLGVLVGMHRRADRAGRRLVLHGVPPRLGRLLLATRLHRVLNIDDAMLAG